MRVLLSSVGRRGYLVNYFREALGSTGEVWGGDSCAYSPAFEYCDKSIVLPSVDGKRYVEKILEICRDGGIDIVIPLIDPELEVLAKRRDDFAKAGVMVVVSPLTTVEISYDKFLLYEFCQKHDIATAKTFLSVSEAMGAIGSGQLHWPVVVKPRKGSASANISYCENEAQLIGAFDECPDPMIQEKLGGDEYGYDIFGNADFETVRVFCKKKLAMRAGETDKAISTCDTRLIEFGYKFAGGLEVFGPMDADVMVDSEGPKLLEINPRFGGGYPTAHLCGMDYPGLLMTMKKGEKIDRGSDDYPDGVYMLKQDEIIKYTAKQVEGFRANG